jgi:multicomponent Na+:H+ antiporter subunit E
VSRSLASVLLAFLWTGLTGRFDLANLLVGVALGHLVVYLGEPERGAFRRTGRAVGFVLYFLSELVRSSLRIAYDVVTRRHHMRPAVVGVPLAAESDAEITLLAQVISLTPGSVSLDVSPDRKTLFVHMMYASDLDAARRHIKDGFERRVLELLR